MNSLLRLPFDQYQRYRLVADLILKMAGKETFSILDVGGRTELLRRFLPDHRVTIVDVDPSDAEGLILGSGAALPFGDNAFDVVCAFDTLEHVPLSLRDDFVKEFARVSRSYAILAGPYQHPKVQHSEELLQKFLVQKVGQRHRYLEEHRDLGLPDREHTESLLRTAGGKVESIGHGRLDRWLLSMCLELYVESDPLLQPLGASFYEFYNELVYPHDHGELHYRHVVIAAFGKAQIPAATEVLSSPIVPEKTERLLASYGEEILALDGHRRIWEPERKRLQGIIASLEKDLKEHTLSLTDARADLEEHKSSLATLTEDLAEHKRSLRTTETDLNEHKSTLVSTQNGLDQHKLSLAACEDDLNQHRQVLKETEAALAEHREALTAVEAERAEFARGAEQQAEHLQAEAAKVTQYARGLESRVRTLEEHNQRLAGIEEDRDRLLAQRQEAERMTDEANRLVDQINGQLVDRDREIAKLARDWTHAKDHLEAQIQGLTETAKAANADLRQEREERMRLQRLIATRWNLFKLWLKPSAANQKGDS